MHRIAPITSFCLALVFLAACQATPTKRDPAVFPFYASKLDAEAVATGRSGAVPVELPSEMDIELIGSVSCDSPVALVRSRTGKRGWIPVEFLPQRLQISLVCASKTTN